VQHQPFPLTSLLDDLIVITTGADGEGRRSFQTIIQRVGADPELLREQITQSERAARIEHRRAELWGASYVVERWLRSGAPSASNAQLDDALRLLGFEGGSQQLGAVARDDASKLLRDRLNQRLDALDVDSSE
jgi:hypothetical protein